MRATQSLPDGYQKLGTIDISRDQRLLLILNVFGFILMVAAGWLFFRAIFWLRPSDSIRGLLALLRIGNLLEWAVLIGAILGLTALHVILHEAIHGIFFWLFTHTRPRFAFRGAYAYAAAPDWFIPRNLFLVTTLAPLVLISLAGLLMIGSLPPGWLLPTWLVVTMNAGGAVGDILVAGWLLIQPKSCLAQDCGDAVTLFVRREPQ